MDKTGLGSYSGRPRKAFLFISFRAANAAKERLLSVGTNGGGYMIFLCTNKDDLSQKKDENGSETKEQSKCPNMHELIREACPVHSTVLTALGPAGVFLDGDPSSLHAFYHAAAYYHFSVPHPAFSLGLVYSLGGGESTAI